jgi:DNA replication and repair protein RecF
MRRAALFDLLDELDAQAFMTGTDVAAFAPLADRANMLAVSDGRIEAGA